MTEKKLSIAYLSPGWPLNQYPNGIVTYVENIISGLGEDTIGQVVAGEVKGDKKKTIKSLEDFAATKSLLDRILNKVLFKLKIPYAQNKLNKRKRLSHALQIKRALGSFEITPELIEVEESFGIANWLVREIDFPVITRLHGPWFIVGSIMKLSSNYDYMLRVKAEGRAINASHGVTAPSLDVLTRVREFYGVPLPNAKVIPNPVQMVPTDLQWKYNPEDVPTILVVGRFDSVKGGDLSIDAFRIVALQNKEVTLKFVGPDQGVDVDGELYSFPKYLDKFVPEKNIRNRIEFLGHCDSNKVSQLRRNTTVTMMTSRYDNFPMSLLESVATGSPVVGTAVGGIKEIIINEFNGLLANADSPAHIAEKVLELLGDSEKMQLLSKNAIADSRVRFSPEIVAKQTVEFYHTVLNKI